VDVPPDAGPVELARLLTAVLDADPNLETVLVIVGDRPIGRTSRSYLHAVLAGPHRVGEAERATLPGQSTHYRAIGFICARCGRQAYRSFYDERYRPTCPGDPVHGMMALS
jgi:hypothetical protein